MRAKVYFGAYELMCRRWSGPEGGLGGLPPALVAGGFAGQLSWGSIYPLDVIKTKYTSAPHGTYTSVPHCVRMALAREGPRALMRGFGATMARAWPQNAALFYTYETIKAKLS